VSANPAQRGHPAEMAAMAVAAAMQGGSNLLLRESLVVASSS
jgi:hypothetical protein